MSLKKYRWGFSGSGGISQRAVCDIARLERAEVFAIASRQQETADQFARRYGLKQAYVDFERLCQDPDVDIIYIGTPHVYHNEQTQLALRHGKAVLCEKPLSVSAADTQAMIQSAERHSVFLMEGLWTRFLPVIQQVRHWLKSGEIGEVLRVEAAFCSQSPLGPDSRVFSKKLGGGALLDLGVYPISVVCYLLEQPLKKISAKGVMGETQVDVETEVTLEFEQNITAVTRCSLLNSNGEALRIQGTRGTIDVPFFWRASEAILSREGRVVKQVEGAASFESEAAEVMKALDEGRLESEIMPWRDSLHIAEIMDEALRQIAGS